MANKILHTTIMQKNASGENNIIYPKTVAKNVIDGSTTLDKTLETLKAPDISARTTTFTQAATRQNLVSGESLATSHGKIMKLISDLKSLAYSDKVGVSNLDSTLTTAYNNRVTTDKVTTSTSITSAGYVADARAVNSLQNQINTLNSNYTNLGKSVADGKNLIGSVVGGNSNSTFQVLANNARSIKNERDSYSTQLTSMTKSRPEYKVYTQEIINNGILISNTKFVFKYYLRLMIGSSGYWDEDSIDPVGIIVTSSQTFKDSDYKGCIAVSSYRRSGGYKIHKIKDISRDIILAGEGNSDKVTYTGVPQTFIWDYEYNNYYDNDRDQYFIIKCRLSQDGTNCFLYLDKLSDVYPNKTNITLSIVSL